MFEIQLVLGFLALFSLWAAVDVVTAPAGETRAMPKPAWAALVVGTLVVGLLSVAAGSLGATMLPAMAAMGWLLVGRPDGRAFLPRSGAAGAGGANRSPSSGPSRRPRSARSGSAGGPYGEPVSALPADDQPISDRRSAELDRELDEWQARQRRDTERPDRSD